MADEKRGDDVGETPRHAGTPAASEGGSGGTVERSGSGRGDADKAGKPADFLSAFAGAATKWTQETGDPDISKAFLLGWRVGVALDWAATGAHELWPDDDPGLDDAGRWVVLSGQIESAAKELTSVDDSIPLGALGDGPPEPESGAVCQYRTTLLQRLYVTDQFRGLAFTVGCDLERACAGRRKVTPDDQPDETPTTEEDVGRAKTARELSADIPALKKPLLGLATKLPPNAAHGVINSLTLWEEQLTRYAQRFDRNTLRKQGGVWRSMLSGDVAAKDLLHLSDYVGTAEQVAADLKDFAKRTVKEHLLLPALGVIALALAGFVLLLFSSTAAAGAGALLTALGLSWRGIGQYFGKAAARGEQSLWDGQLDWTIAYRATMSLAEPTRPPRRSRKAAKQMSREQRRRADHFETWQRWKDDWPVFEMEV